MRYQSPMDDQDVRDFGAEVVVLATGSQPAGTGFQKWRPEAERLPGLEHGKVWPVEEVMARSARPGERVILLDEAGNWRGCGTAWHPAEQGHEVTLVTPDPMVGRELMRTASDLPIRKRLKELGVEFVTEALVKEWHGDGATLTLFLDGSEWQVAAGGLVLATTNHPDGLLQEALADDGLELHAIGDCVAPRRAPYAFYEGAKLGRSL